VLFLSDATPRMELERRLREMDRIASVGLLGLTLGHDMINALLPIRANLNAIRLLIPEHLRGPTVSRSLDAVEQGVSYLQHLAEGAGGFAGDLCEAPPESSDGGLSLDLCEWWNAVEPVVRTALSDEIRLECAFAEGVPRVKIPRHDLTRSMLNLVVNARQAIEVRQGVGLQPGRVLFEFEPWMHRKRPAARIRIRDNGVGMAASVRARAGQPLFTTKLDGSGTGLGLYSARRTLASAGGMLHIESVVGVGTTISMLLPSI
jgi:signal transduction histidine kinase